LEERVVIEVINGGNISTNLENTNPDIKGHPHPWKDGTQPDWVCQILLMWTHRNIKK
jgi:hypothetical protein